MFTITIVQKSARTDPFLYKGEIVVTDEDGYVWDIFQDSVSLRETVETERDKAAASLAQALRVAEDAQIYLDAMVDLAEKAKSPTRWKRIP